MTFSVNGLAYLAGVSPPRTLGSLLVVLASPRLDDRPSVSQAREPVFVQTLVAQSTVERFDLGILVRLARLDQAQRHCIAIGPGEHRFPAELRTVVGANHRWSSALGADAIEDPR
jgi:hypothetical protein